MKTNYIFQAVIGNKKRRKDTVKRYRKETIYKQRLNGRDRDDSGAFISKRTKLTMLPLTGWQRNYNLEVSSS